MSETAAPENMTAWNCRAEYAFDDLPDLEKSSENDVMEEGVPLTKMTVGRKFLLRCQGEPAFFERKNLKLVTAPENQFSLHLLEIRRLDEKSGDFLMTSYRAGTHDFKGLKLSDGSQTVELAGPAVTVETVLRPQDGKPPQPFGAFGPVVLQWPWVVWAALAALILVLLAGVFAQIWRKVKRRRMLEGLKQFQTALQPFDQFNKEVRQLKRRLEFAEAGQAADWSGPLGELEKSIRFYLLREFQLPAHEWSEQEILKDLKKRHRRVFQAAEDDLRMTFRELKKARDGAGKLTPQDLLLLLQLSQKSMTRVWRSQDVRGAQ